MKAIFLDVDGVVATPMSVRLNYLLGRGPERQWYDPISLSYLRRLVEGTGAIVVLASNWRIGLASDDPPAQAIMRNLFDQLDAAGAPVSHVTPLMGDTDRSGEIGAWLGEHPCEAYVILDDLASFEDRPEVAAGHLVLVEDSAGIRWQHYRRALEILSAELS